MKPKSTYSWPQVPQSPETFYSAAHPMFRGGRQDVDRSNLHFPEIRAGSDGDELLQAIVGKAVDAYSLRKRLCDDYIRAVSRAQPGLAASCAKLEAVQRTLSTSGSEGGYTIPAGFVAELIRDAEKLDSLYAKVRKVPVSQKSGTVPKTATNASVSWGTEGNDITSGDPSFGETPYAVARLNALAKFNKELVDDSGIDIVGTVYELFTEAIQLERDRVIAVGTGTGQPMGLYSADGITNVSVTALSYATLLELKFSVDQKYHRRPAFCWHFNSDVLRATMGIVDDNNRPLFRDAMAGEPPTLLGVPYVVCNSFPNNYIGIGDLSYYLWFTRGETTIDRSADAGEAFQKILVWLRLVERVDGKPSLPPTVPLARSRVLAGIS
jgi:HK97 family phage major capsid protein